MFMGSKKMKKIENNLERTLPFDTFGRYRLITDIINLNRNKQSLKILDVGGRYNILKKFLPNDEVHYLDLEINPKDENAFKGDGCDMPFKDNSYDFCVSADVFEHIPLKKRKKFLKECIRVSKNAMILAAPFYSKEVQQAEINANESFKILSGSDHIWLKEHLENGLPDESEVLGFIKERNLYFQKTYINDLRLWEQLIRIGFIATDFNIFGKEFEDFNDFYNTKVFPFDRSPDSYRKVFLIKKENEFKDLPKEEKITEEIVSEVLMKSTNLYLKAVNQLEDKQKIREKKLKKEHERMEEYQAQIQQLQKELNEKNKEIERIKKSTSWKITKPIRNTKTTANKVTRLSKKSKSVIQTEGFNTFVRKAARFSHNRVRIKFSGGGVNFLQNYSDVKKEYAKKKRKATIIIPSFNDYKVLKKCLASINKTVESAWVNIIIVDDASTDTRHIEFLKTINQKNIKIIYQKMNSGFAKTVNAAFKKVKSGDVIILNSDTEAKEFWLESLQVAAYSDDKIGIVGPKLLYPNGTIQYGGSHRNTDSPEWFDHYYRFKPSNFPQANIPNYVIGITGACMYVKRSVIKKVGFLDEKFPMAFEDMDYCIRAWNEGFRSLYFPMATLTHHESLTRGTSQGAREKESLRYFWEKWGDWFDKRNIKNSKGVTKIIYVLQATGVGGGHRMVFEHVNRLKGLGYDIELWALEDQPKWFQLKVKVKKFKNYEQLISALEKEEAIKVATWWETAEPVWLASVTKGIPAFYLQDVESSYYKDDKYMQNFVLSKYKKEFTYLTICNWNKAQLAELGLDATVVACGIDSKTFKPVKTKREENVIIAIGRSHYLKNLSMTMNAWKKIKKNQPALWLFGIEPQLTDGLKNAEYFFKPSDQGVNELYNKATVLIQTSIHEGFCLPILEAMAAGALVVCTDAHGNADFCVDEKNCLMVGQNDVEGLKKAIVRIFEDKNLQKRLREEGYKKAREYDWPVIMKNIEGVYKELALSTKKKHS